MMNKQPSILFLFSDTGGGHRSAAEAIIEAIQLEFPGQFDTRMVDIFRQYAPLPLNYAPDIYPHLSRYPKMWKLGYEVSDGTRRIRAFYDVMWPYLRRAVHQLLKENPVDLIVSVHQLVNIPLLRSRLSNNIRFVTVVTDLVSTHSAWYHTGADLVIVPTIPAKEKALKSGLPTEKIMVIGQPIAQKFVNQTQNKIELRDRFGWDKDLLTVLLVGGGEGMGNLERHAMAINHSNLPIQLIIVAGRNQPLKTKLENQKWNMPTRIFAFVKEMPEFMQASDILITKAGPGTISEAFIAGLPLILYSKMPGQEDGNVGYVTNQGAGIWAPNPDQLVECLINWINHPEELKMVALRSTQLAKPNASRDIAKALEKQLRITLDNRT
ncbi:MAG: galactosyldiacylglycerol synthase [Chloroflexi bacterium HGW-Chloroflexi-2]|jgi:1,2-diacylglycerol 3-beta-galactosyltransferase|nr:MAG: galactosyldiacylglycerol synthase [Chloroflexi bacterium HGW-Chloroflexi-2]